MHVSEHPYSERQVYLPPVQGDTAIAVGAERDEPAFGTSSMDPALAPFKQDLQWYEGRELRRLSLVDAEDFIPIVEKRLELNGALLLEYVRQLEVTERAIDDDERQIAAAYAPVERVMRDDDARLGGPPAGVIMTHTIAIGPDVWVASRTCYLRDTAEWKRFQAVKMRTAGDASKHRAERTDLQRKLVDERDLTVRLESRLYHLREHVSWWQREFELVP